MTAPAQRPPVLPVPTGTPGRDANIGQPPPLPPGPPQPTRKLGPGTRTWVVVVTAVGAVILAVLAVLALLGGTVNSMVSQGRLVLEPGQYSVNSGQCTGANGFQAARKGAEVQFDATTGDGFSATITRSVLHSGSCYLVFNVRTLGIGNQVYSPRIGEGRTTPVTGTEIKSGAFDLHPVAG